MSIRFGAFLVACVVPVAAREPDTSIDRAVLLLRLETPTQDGTFGVASDYLVRAGGAGVERLISELDSGVLVREERAAGVLLRLGQTAAGAARPLAQSLARGNLIAGFALEQIGGAGADAVPILAAALSHPVKDIAEEAAMLLAAHGARGEIALSCLEGMVETARGGDRRDRVIRAIGSIGTARAARALASLLKDRGASTRFSALETLAHLGRAAEATATMTRALSLSEQDPRLRAAAAAAVISTSRGDRWAEAILVRMLVKGSPAERASAARSLATVVSYLGDDSALREAALDPNPLVAIPALMATPTVDVRRVRQRLESLLVHDAAWDMPETLVLLRRPELLTPWIAEELAGRVGSGQVKDERLREVMRKAPALFARPLGRQLESANSRTIVELLAELGPAAEPVLVHALESPATRHNALLAASLMRHRSSALAAKTRELLQSDNSAIRLLAAQATWSLTGDWVPSVAVLEDLTTSGEGFVSVDALNLLMALCLESGIPFGRVLQSTEKLPEYSRPIAAFAAMCLTDSRSSALGVLRESLRDKSTRAVTCRLVAELDRLASSLAPDLVVAASDSDDAVRVLAARAHMCVSGDCEFALDVAVKELEARNSKAGQLLWDCGRRGLLRVFGLPEKRQARVRAALGGIWDGPTLAQLAEIATDHDEPRTRLAACKLFVDLSRTVDLRRDRRGISLIAPALEDPDDRVFRVALHHLETASAASLDEAAATVARLLRHGSPSRRVAAARLSSSVRSETEVGRLVPMLRRVASTDEDQAVRRAAQDALDEIHAR